MARTQDLPVLHQIIEAMDVKLSQVLIETVIIEVGLSDTIKTGIDWVHQISGKQAISGGGGTTSTFGTLESVAASGVSASTGIPVSSGLNYAGLSDKLNLGMVVEASKADTRTKYLASPIIMTVDNKEATIEATQMRYMLTGFTSSGTSYSTIAVPNYEQKEIGITIKTTPKINPNGTVMLSVEEEYSQLGETQTIQTNGGMSGTAGASTALMDVNVDTTVTRKMSADISLEDGQSVVIGGLTETKVEVEENGIPILKDIPWVGRYLFGSTKDVERRKELLVFMTPYVLKDGDSAEAEAARRKKVMSDSRPWEDRGWSKSSLADPVGNKEQLRRQQDEWAREDEERANELAIEKARMDRVLELEKKALDERKMTIEEAKERIDKLNQIEEEKAALRGEADIVERENNNLLKQLQSEHEATQETTPEAPQADEGAVAE
jgi:type II secretory pathway component GspD/PulD (secretin)